MKTVSTAKREQAAQPPDRHHRQREDRRQQQHRCLPVHVPDAVLQLPGRVGGVGHDQALPGVVPLGRVRRHHLGEGAPGVRAGGDLDRGLLAAAGHAARHRDPDALAVHLLHRGDLGVLGLLVEADARALALALPLRGAARPQQHQAGGHDGGEGDQHRGDQAAQMRRHGGGRAAVGVPVPVVRRRGWSRRGGVVVVGGQHAPIIAQSIRALCSAGPVCR
jgi:hypothetical protein